MKLLAVEMKERGTYVSSQISYENLKFLTKFVDQSAEFDKLYNHCTEIVG